MKIKSSAFRHNQTLDKKFTCEGDDVSPPLTFLDVPKEAKSLALIVEDPDAPKGVFTHWLVWNIDPDRKHIEQGAKPSEAVVGINDMGNIDYGGPCPPKGHGEHRYFFKLYALSKLLGLEAGAKKKQLRSAMEGIILEESEIIGLYERV